MLKYKIVVAGAKNVGKSSLIARYCDDIFNEKTKETIGVAFKRKEVRIKEDLNVELNIWDFGGEEKYRILFPAYVNGATAALLLYDTTKKSSLDDIGNWVKIIDENSKDIIKVIIGTKIDLKDQREISKTDAIKASKIFNCYGEPIGTSSKTSENVENAFLNIVNAIIEKQLQECSKCGNYFSAKLKICNYCGEVA
ncbi:MAG: GTP-binding protein [Candidatus Lokiarchaeota archaeon]|nr:GTP-binding protein [Candidatus Lokiarchaeota archaeon]